MTEKPLLPPSIISVALRVLGDDTITTERDLMAKHSLLDIVFLGTHEKRPPSSGARLDAQSEANYRRMSQLVGQMGDSPSADTVEDFINAATLMAAGPDAEEEAEAHSRSARP